VDARPRERREREAADQGLHWVPYTPSGLVEQPRRPFARTSEAPPPESRPRRHARTWGRPGPATHDVIPKRQISENPGALQIAALRKARRDEQVLGATELALSDLPALDSCRSVPSRSPCARSIGVPNRWKRARRTECLRVLLPTCFHAGRNPYRVIPTVQPPPSGSEAQLRGTRFRSRASGSRRTVSK